MADVDVPEAWVTLPTSEEIVERLGPPESWPDSFPPLEQFPHMGRLIMVHDRIGPRAVALFLTMMTEPEAVSRQEAELLAGISAAAQDCTYCTQGHAELLRLEGGSAELVDAIKEGRWQELDLPPRTRALGDIAQKLSGEPTKMVEEDWQPLRELGFDDRGIMEVAHIVSFFNYCTRLADGLGLQLHPWALEAPGGDALPGARSRLMSAP